MRKNRSSAALRPALERRLVALALVLLSAASQAAGVVTHLSGTLTVKKADGTSKLLSVKSEVATGDTLITLEGTYARVKFEDGSEVVLRPNSQMTVTDFRFKPAEPSGDSAVLSLIKGGMRAVTGVVGKRNPERVGVNTVTATIGVRGTHFGMLMCQGDCGAIPTITGKPPADGLHIDVADGVVSVTNTAGQSILSAGQFGFVASATTAPTIVPPQQGIQVTMPESISRNEAGGRSVGKGREASECAVQ